MVMRTLIMTAVIGSGAMGCAALTSNKLDRTPAQLREVLGPRLTELRPKDIVIPHEVSKERIAEAREYIADFLGPKPTIEDEVRALIRALSSQGGFALRYEWAKTLSAEATLEHGGGSCLSLSAVLIALARGLGVRAYFVDASAVTNETQRDGDVTVHSGHIAVLLRYKHANAYVDFAGEFNDWSRAVRLSDLEVVAHYYNNRGYELIHDAQKDEGPVPWADALRYFRIATKVWPNFPLAWNNVGLALWRLGRQREAALAFRYALSFDGGLEAALRNLAALPDQMKSTRAHQALLSSGKGLKWKTAAEGPAAIKWKIRAEPEVGSTKNRR